MNDISLNFRQSAYASETGRVPIILITCEHEDLIEPIRLSSDPTTRLSETDADIVYGTTSRGNDYVFLPLRIRLPDDTADGPGNMQLEIDNVSRQLVEVIRTISAPLPLLVEVVMDNALDTVDLTWPEYVLTNISYDAGLITGTLVLATLV